MCSEEPKSEIFDNENHPGGKVDIWLPVLNNYNQTISFWRSSCCDESTWIYFLHGTKPPFLNPITIDHPGAEARLLGNLLWKFRMEGIAYYATNSWGSNPYTNPSSYGQNGNTFLSYPPDKNGGNIAYGSNNHRFVPSIRFELMRDGLEDWEYLYILNGNKKPEVTTLGTDADLIVQKLILDIKSYVYDDDYIYDLRRLMGLYIGGEGGITMDDLKSSCSPFYPHSRASGSPGNYYINFQDPTEGPTDDPLIVNGKTWEKIGWISYDSSNGYGWYGDLSNVMSSYLSGTGNPLQRSILFDDWGRRKTFQYVVPNGCYDVSVSIGWWGRNYRRNKVWVNEVVFFDDEESGGVYQERTMEVCVTNYRVSLTMGIFDEYTMLNYMSIETNGKEAFTGTNCNSVNRADLIPVVDPGGGETDGDGDGGEDDPLMELVPMFNQEGPGGGTTAGVLVTLFFLCCVSIWILVCLAVCVVFVLVVVLVVIGVVVLMVAVVVVLLVLVVVLAVGGVGIAVAVYFFVLKGSGGSGTSKPSAPPKNRAPPKPRTLPNRT